MARIASVLSVIALLAALFAYSVTHWAFPPVGFEGMIVFGGLSFWLGSVAAAIAMLIGIYRLLCKRPDKKWPLACAVTAGVVLFVAVTFP
jgi:hypothetical protein